MGSRMKEDEKNEKIIRGLLKLPPNRKCINCNLLGPQYVCTTFSTFVCTTCGGIHREFTHRVKSVSMAKFTPQEIAALQAGGNERAKEIYFKDWDPQRQSAPDSNNVDRLRDFIKHVYVNRKYSGEKGSDRPPRGKLGDKEEPIENRRSDGYLSGSRSPAYDDRYDRRSSGRSSPGYGARSPGYEQENQRHSDYGRSPVRSGIISDWRREDRFSNGSRSDDRRSSDGEGKLETPDVQKDATVSSPPTIRPVGEILGDNVVPLRISEPPRANSIKIVDGSKNTQSAPQRTASSSSLASSNGNPVEIKRETSLIDFDTEPEPPKRATVTQAEQSTASQSVSQSTNSQSDDNWACFDSVPNDNALQAPQSMNPLESILTELTVPVPGHSSGSTGSNAVPVTSNVMFPSTAANPGVAPSAIPPSTNLSALPSGGAGATRGLPPTLFVNGDNGTYQQSPMQHQQPITQLSASQSAASQFISAFPSGSNSQGSTSDPAAQPPQTVEVKSSDRKELPANLFTSTYSFAPYQNPGWRAGPGGMFPGMGFPMQYNPAMSMPTYPQVNRSSNPFDAEGSSVQAAAFPSMSSLHATLPNAAAPNSVSHPGMHQWMPPQMSTAPPIAPSSGYAMPPGMYMGQHQPPNMITSRPQGIGSYGSDGPAFGSLNPASAIPNPSLGGNPFG